MDKLSIGDEVIVHRPDDVNESPAWVSEMDKFDGVEGWIKEISDNRKFVRISGASEFWYNPKWCERVETKFEIDDTQAVDSIIEEFIV